MKKIVNIIILSLMVILVITPGCLEDDETEQEQNIVYEFNISSTKVLNSSIILPVPTFNNETIGFDYSSGKLLEGDANLSLVKTKYGRCLKIDINQSSSLTYKSIIKWNESIGEYPQYKLSTADRILSNNVEYYSWLKNECDVNTTITLRFHNESAGYGHMIGTTVHSKEIILEPGWQKVLVDNRFPTP